jgi:hypothetical protein
LLKKTVKGCTRYENASADMDAGTLTAPDGLIHQPSAKTQQASRLFDGIDQSLLVARYHHCPPSIAAYHLRV